MKSDGGVTNKRIAQLKSASACIEHEPTSRTEIQVEQETVLNLRTCRICLENEGDLLISVCDCSGSIQSVHLDCVQRWIEISNATTCEICQATYNHELLEPKTSRCIPRCNIFSWRCLLAVLVSLFLVNMVLILIFNVILLIAMY